MKHKIKKWEDKTDEEFKADVEAMIAAGKLTEWHWDDGIKTIEDAKNYVEAIREEWFEESGDANDCIVGILESYMEFLNIFEATIKKDVISQRVRMMADTLCKQEKNKWQPILDTAKKMQKARESAKKSA